MIGEISEHSDVRFQPHGGKQGDVVRRMFNSGSPSINLLLAVNKILHFLKLWARKHIND